MEKTHTVLGLMIKVVLRWSEEMCVVLDNLHVKIPYKHFAARNSVGLHVAKTALDKFSLHHVMHDSLNERRLPNSVLSPDCVYLSGIWRKQLLNNLVHFFVSTNELRLSTNLLTESSPAFFHIYANSVHDFSEKSCTGVLLVSFLYLLACFAVGQTRIVPVYTVSLGLIMHKKQENVFLLLAMSYSNALFCEVEGSTNFQVAVEN